MCWMGFAVADFVGGGLFGGEERAEALLGLVPLFEAEDAADYKASYQE